MPILVPGMLPAIKRIGMKGWVVRLEAEERSRLEPWVRTGKVAAYKIRHANVLLAVDEPALSLEGSDAGPGLPDERVVELKIVEHGSRETIRRTLKKKRDEALATEDVVHSARGRHRVRPDGRRFAICSVLDPDPIDRTLSRIVPIQLMEAVQDAYRPWSGSDRAWCREPSGPTQPNFGVRLLVARRPSAVPYGPAGGGWATPTLRIRCDGAPG